MSWATSLKNRIAALAATMLAAVGLTGGPSARATVFPVTTVAAGSYLDVEPLPDAGYLATGTEQGRYLVWKVLPDGSRERFAGDPQQPPDSSGDGGPALAAGFKALHGITRTDGGVVFLNDDRTLRGIGTDGTITTVASTGGNAAGSVLWDPIAGVLYADEVNAWTIDADGSGTGGYGGRQYTTYDFTHFGYTVGQLAIKPDGSLLLAVTDGNRVYALNHAPTSSPVVVAGSTLGYSGDGGPATAARLNHPWGLQLLPSGAFAIGDRDNDAIRLVEGDTIDTIAHVTRPQGMRIAPAGLVIAGTDGLYLLHKTQILAAPRAYVDTPAASVSFSSYYSGPSFQCRLDAGAWAACTSPYSVSGLADGAHEVAVRAIDATGVDPTPATARFVIDTTGPNTAITDQSAAYGKSRSAIFAFTSPQAGATFTCSLDGATEASCTSPQTYDGLPDGSHTFAVRATTADGHPDPTPAQASWTVDNVAPTATITQQPPAHAASRTATFAFASPDGATRFECRLDDAPFLACTSPTALSALATGDHHFDVRAIDGAGNVQSPPVSVAWTVDSSPPETSLASHPEAATRETTAVFELTADEQDVTYRCAFDASALAPCPAVASAVDLADGVHRFRAVARDAAGNEDATPVDFTWTVDTRAPIAAQLVTPANGDPGVRPVPVLTFRTASDGDGSGIATQVVELDDRPVDGAALSCGINHVCTLTPPAPLSTGTHRWRVVATDAAGNTSASGVATFVTDADPPTGLAAVAPRGRPARRLARA